MKKIGLLGGTSWISTIEYYRTINRLVSEVKGGFYSGRILLHSINYEPIKSQYGDLDNHTICELLWAEVEHLMSCKPDCFVLCNNTLHEFFDIEKFQAVYDVPVFSASQLSAQYLQHNDLKNALLLGTKNTMTRAYYKDQLSLSGANVHVPVPEDIDTIFQAQLRVSKGDLSEDALLNIKREMRTLLEKYAEYCDVVVLACTELPLVIDQLDGMDVIDPAYLQCVEAVNFAVADSE